MNSILIRSVVVVLLWGRGEGGREGEWREGEREGGREGGRMEGGRDGSGSVELTEAVICGVGTILFKR